MTTLDLNTRTLARALELKQKLELERRHNAHLKIKAEQKNNQDFFNRQLGIKLQPLTPLQGKLLLSQKQKQEAALQLSKQLRMTHMPNGFSLTRKQPRPEYTSDEYRKQLLHALKMLRRQEHAKKQRLEKLAAQREHTQQEIAAQQHRAQF